MNEDIAEIERMQVVLDDIIRHLELMESQAVENN